MTDTVYLLLHGTDGLEQIFNLSEELDINSPEERMVRKLKDVPPPDSRAFQITTMQLRARYNAQRKLKVYGIKLPFTEEEIWNLDREMLAGLLSTHGEVLG